MASLDELRITFFQECEDLLDRLGEGLRDLSVTVGQYDMETVHAVFRAVHSIKGGAAAFALDELVAFAHLFETVLDELRQDRLTLDIPMSETLLRAGDTLTDLVGAAREDRPAPRDRINRIAAELDALADGGGADDGGRGDADFGFEPVALAFDMFLPPAGGPGDDVSDGVRQDAIRQVGGSDPEAVGPQSGLRHYRIRFVPSGEFYPTGNEPAGLIRALSDLGSLALRADLDRIAALANLDLARPGLGWVMDLQTSASPEDIAAIFDFVTDIADIQITDPAAPSQTESHPVPPPQADPAPSPTDRSDKARDVDPPLARIDPPPLMTAPPAASTAPGPAPPATIRVNLDRVDRLINLIGELVIMEAMLSQVIASVGLAANSEVSGGLDRIRQLASEIQEGVMAIRAQPLKPVFQRMDRILREACDFTGKKARLVSIGEATEVDKTVIERLVDPLTHMIRNSVDHGLEDSDRRQAVGKAPDGTITLSAAHRSGRVIIEVSDDGGGINRSRVREVAEGKGLIAPGTVLTPSEIDNLLFLPGFSSKADVSAISGRGVGLDVVRREIQSLGGRVSISSTEGAGTTFTIALPLTLAVLEGMLLEFGHQSMVLPLSAIVETLSPASATIHALGATGRVVANRGELIPIIDLAEFFGLESGRLPFREGVLVVVETDAGGRAALAADHILDQRQVVIKSLEENYGTVSGISAATILGDGRIALIIDHEEVVRTARSENLRADLPALASMKG